MDGDKKMREYKFRVWDGKRKRFHYWGFNVNGIKSFTGVPTSNHINLADVEKLSEQYTGLKDKNGKEIYYGDRISFVYEIPSYPRQYKHLSGTLVYNSDAIRAEIDIDPEYEKNGYVCLWFDSTMMSNIKVIGNIHDEK